MFSPVASCSYTAARPQAATFVPRRCGRPAARHCLVVRAATTVPAEVREGAGGVCTADACSPLFSCLRIVLEMFLDFAPTLLALACDLVADYVRVGYYSMFSVVWGGPCNCVCASACLFPDVRIFGKYINMPVSWPRGSVIPQAKSARCSVGGNLCEAREASPAWGRHNCRPAKTRKPVKCDVPVQCGGRELPTLSIKELGRAHLADTVPHGCACEQYKTVAPVGDRVLVKVDVSEAKSTGGILLPTSAQKKPTQGEITSAGSAKAVKACALALVGWNSAALGTLRHPHCCIRAYVSARMQSLQQFASPACVARHWKAWCLEGRC